MIEDILPFVGMIFTALLMSLLILLVLLLCREITCWYFKLTEIRDLLRSIEKKIPTAQHEKAHEKTKTEEASSFTDLKPMTPTELSEDAPQKKTQSTKQEWGYPLLWSGLILLSMLIITTTIIALKLRWFSSP